jgi:tetratricopeptide (TPR) repeat protein
MDEDERTLREAIKINPNDAEAHRRLGSLLISLERYKEAEEELRQAIRLKPDYAEAEILLNKLERKISSSKETSSERSSSGCFIATAVYGDENAVELKILRDFRDTVLLRNSLGRLFVSLYYFISPSIANIIKKSEYAKNFVKKVFIEPSLLLVMYIINRKERR